MAYSQKRAVEQYSLDGEYINEFDSLGLASMKTGVLKSGIWQCCKGTYKSSGGFLWKYK